MSRCCCFRCCFYCCYCCSSSCCYHIVLSLILDFAVDVVVAAAAVAGTVVFAAVIVVVVAAPAAPCQPFSDRPLLVSLLQVRPDRDGERPPPLPAAGDRGAARQADEDGTGVRAGGGEARNGDRQGQGEDADRADRGKKRKRKLGIFTKKTLWKIVYSSTTRPRRRRKPWS